MWPEHTERKSNSREMFLSTQALRHLMPSPSPMDMLEEIEQTTHTDEPEEEQPVQNVCIFIVPAIRLLIFTAHGFEITPFMCVLALATTRTTTAHFFF